MALSTFIRKVHEPREMSAMCPAGNPAKSAVLQPVAIPAGSETGAVTSPLPELDMMRKSLPLT
jgi:hypothetical protein